MAKVIAIANQKGGVAKTTTAAAMAAGLLRRGYKVLAVDLDAQGNLSDSVGADEQGATTYELMKGSETAVNAIQKTSIYDIIPANLSLASADMEFTQTGREYRLKKALTPVMDIYDYIILDTPPTLGIMTVNAFICCDEVIIPASGVDGVKGITNLYNTIETVRDFGNANLRIAGILLTMYNSRTIIDKNIKELAELIGAPLNIPLFQTAIRASVSVDEAKANRIDIFSYNEKNNVSVDYNDFVDEYLDKVRGDK
jgi:ATPases involved in chromosome partitioning